MSADQGPRPVHPRRARRIEMANDRREAVVRQHIVNCLRHGVTPEETARRAGVSVEEVLVHTEAAM